MKLNWKVRFNLQNKTFLTRFFISVFLPVLVYYGMEVTDITSWKVLGDIFVKALSNPYVVGCMIVNCLNILPDPTTSGVGDSVDALNYDKPK